MPVLKFDAESTLLKLKRIARAYAASGKAGWLDRIDWEAIPVDFPASLPADILGMYAFGRIRLRQSLSVHAIFPTYIHELRHRWQWKTTPIKYLLGKIFRSPIEADAVTQEVRARTWIEDPRTIAALRHLD